MKTLLLIAGLLVAGTAHAEDMCIAFGDMAETIMENRQMGTDMSKLMSIKSGDETADKLAHSLVVEAYKQPRWSNEENKEQAKKDFRNQVELVCYTRTKK